MNEPEGEQATLNEITDESTDEEHKLERVGLKELKLPSQWEVSKIGEVSDIKNGNRKIKGHEYSEESTGYPFIRVKDMEFGSVSTDNLEYLKEETASQMDRGIITSDDVYITVTGSVGNAGTVPQELSGARFTDNAAKLYNFKGMNNEYLAQYLRSEFGQNEVHRFTAGSNQPKLSMYMIEKMEVIQPILREQQKIASILYNVDQAIQKTAEIIDKRERLKSGLMQDIFRYGIYSDGQLRSPEDNPNQKAKYGLVPEGWEVIPLKNIVADDSPITYGIVKPGDHHPGGVPVVKVENIKNGEVQTDNLLHTDPEIHKKFDRAELKEGDLLFTIRGTVGRMAFVPESLEGGNLTQDTARIRVGDANPRFVRYYLETATPNNYFERHTKGQAVQGVNLEDLQEVPVHLPSREDQKRIVNILDSHTELIQNEREYRDQLKRFKQGLMQDLLSGEVRTTDTSIEVLPEVAQHG
ncbi:restriction endonuclease subunit S [Halosimplex marinum]|uniref:restriction endonuclease subunit S n=1 Tax=Halosimplex marinum TaxID=3396620 RepID=UPI003F57906E